MIDARMSGDDDARGLGRARLATEAGELLLGGARRVRRRHRRRAEGRGGQAFPRLPDGGAGRRAARRRGAVRGGHRGGAGQLRAVERRAGVDRRPARRHQGVLRTRAARTGRCTWRCGSPASWSPAPSRCPRRASRWPRRTSPPRPPRPRHRGSSSRAPGRPRWHWRSATRLSGALVEMGSAGAKVASVVQGHRRCLRACGRAVRVGLGGAGRRGPRGRAVHLAHRRVAADLQPGRRPRCPTSSCADRSWPRRCWRSPGEHRMTQVPRRKRPS